MGTILNRSAYKKIIDEDIEWLLKNSNHSLERWHIIEVLKQSVGLEYDKSPIRAYNIKDNC